jgi:phage recombination protein Bet
MAALYQFEPEEFKRVVKKTCMPGNATEEEFLLFLAAAHELKLNPLTREIFAFARPQGGGIQHIIAADGWYKKANEHPACNGMQCVETFGAGGQLISSTATVHRKDRDYPTIITEYLKENARNTDTWRSRPVRMLRHRALSQAIRIAFGFAGIMDEEEFAKWQETYHKAQANGPVTMIESVVDDIPHDEPKKGTKQIQTKPQPEPPRQAEVVEPEPQPEPTPEPDADEGRYVVVMEPPEPPEPPQYINEQQQGLVEQLILKCGWRGYAIPEVLKVHAGVDSADKILLADLPKVMRAIEKAGQVKAKLSQGAKRQ